MSTASGRLSRGVTVTPFAIVRDRMMAYRITRYRNTARKKEEPMVETATHIEKSNQRMAQRAAEIEQEYVDVATAARFLHCSDANIRRHLTNGVLTRFKALGRTLISIAELRALIKKA
jgi:Fic family protein